MSDFDAPSVPLTSVAFTRHCRYERLPRYGLAQLDIADALGPYLLHGGQPVCRRADDPGEPPEPRVGAPVLIGCSYADDRGPRLIFLGRTRAGRRLHLVVAVEGQCAVVIRLYAAERG